MRKIFIPVIVFSLAVVTGHFGTLKAAPSVIMSKAMQTMAERGIPLHQFVLGSRITPQTQSVVRPSPDLVYSICLFDFSGLDVPLAISAGVWDDYGSISFFDAKTNNFATIRVGAGSSEVVLTPHGMASPADPTNGVTHIKTPTKRGLILIRRLAPTLTAYNRVRDLSVEDQCRPLPDVS